MTQSTSSKAMPAPQRDGTLKETLQRYCEQLGIDRIETGHASAGWFTAADLTGPDPVRVSRLLELEALRVGGDYRTQAASLVEQYAGLLGTVSGLLHLGADIVPDLRPEAVALRTEASLWSRRGGVSGPGRRLRLRLLKTECHVLSGRPATSLSGAESVGSREILRDRLREGLHAHLAPLIARLHQCTRLSPGAQWRLAADALAAVYLDLGRRLDMEPHARSEAIALLKAPGSPLNNPHTGYLEVTAGDPERGLARRTFRVRGGCCRIYTCDGGGYCSTCILEPSDSRYRRLQNSLQV